jgi:hypothetical protein
MGGLLATNDEIFNKQPFPIVGNGKRLHLNHNFHMFYNPGVHI